MSEHASPIALRIAVAGWAGGMTAAFLGGDVTWTQVGTATAASIFIWAIVYVIVYVAEQWLYESGRMKRPEWMTVSDQIVANALVSDRGALIELPVEAGNAYAALGVKANGTPAGVVVYNGVPLDMIKLAIAVSKGMDRISKRQLETYNVVPDRLSDVGDKLIDMLIEKDLVDDIGNSQYAVTERLKTFLTNTTGVKYD